MIVKLLSPTAGSIEYDGQDLFQVPKNQEKALKKEIQIIFQDPYSSLDPKFTVGRIVAEPLVAHGVPKAERIEKVRQLLKDCLLYTSSSPAGAYRRRADGDSYGCTSPGWGSLPAAASQWPAPGPAPWSCAGGR